MSKKLFTPGPANVPQFVRVQLSKDVIHHRMKDYQNILWRVTKKLKQVYNTKQDDIILLTSSGTGAMESAVVNLFSFDEEVLVINTGFFGQRFIEICQMFRLKVHQLDYEWGTTFNLNDVKKVMSENPNIKGVFVTYHETSTGVLNDLKDLGEYVNTTDALFVADCISGMVVHPFEFDGWHLDCAVSASQKGFMLPPGLSIVALSNKAKQKMKLSNIPKYYWDYQKYIDFYKKGQNPYTPAISLVLALDIALDSILEMGINELINKKEALRRYLETNLESIGFELFIKEESIRGNILVPVLASDQYDVNALVDYLDTRHNLTVSKGQGKYKDLMLRVSILSEFTKEDIDDLIEKIKAFKSIED